MIKIKEVLSIFKESQIDEFLKKYTGLTLNEHNLSYENIKKNFKFLGDNPSNGSNIGQLTNGEKGLVERITNAIDAVIEKEKRVNNIVSAKDSSVIIKKAFPKYYKNMQDVIDGNGENKCYAKDAENKVMLVVNDGSKSNKPTFDVIDKGIGLNGDEFKNTILSINHGNKLSRDKSYLIGAFGQGGSTSLAFTYATIILSKKDNHVFFTIIKKVELNDYKNNVYVYLTLDDLIPELDYNDFNCGDSYLNEYVNNYESGTLVRMVEAEISKRFRDNEVNKPGMLCDYLNTELFNVGLPVKVIDNRLDYRNNSGSQNRSIFGSQAKLKTYKYVKNDYCGSINIEHNNRSYVIDYYMLLPSDENKWGNESECKKVFEQFNVYYDPIIYTVNGQTITTERYTKINNAGLNFLRYRLLVVINLDILQTEKYKFFTTDRARIVDSDLTHGFLDKVVKALATNQKLKEINDIIAEKSVSASIDQDLLDEVSKQVKSEYNKFLKTGFVTRGRAGKHYNSTDEEIYNDHIVTFDITSDKRKFFKDENVIFVITTQAQKHVNEGATIDCYIDDKSFYDYQKNVMNGRIQYSFNPGSIKKGQHNISFTYYKSDNETMDTDKVIFEILDEKSAESKENRVTKDLNLNILVVDDSTLICDVSRDEINKKIDIKLCLDTDDLKNEVYGKTASSDDVSKIKNMIIKPIVLFSLFMGENYDNINKDEDKNKLILSLVKSFVSSIESKQIDAL